MLAVLADSLGELLGILGRPASTVRSPLMTLVYMLGARGHKAPTVDGARHEAALFGERFTKRFSSARAREKSLRVDAPLMDSALAEFEEAVETGSARDYIAVSLALERQFQSST